MSPTTTDSPDAPAPTEVDELHEGPPGTGNGGWVCGLVADRLEALVPATPALPAISVRLSAPTPLRTPLRWEVEGRAGEDDLAVHLLAGDTLTATARRAPAPDLQVPAPVSLEDARAAQASADLAGHPFPGCYVCGPDAPAGLHLYPAAVAGRDDVIAGTVTLVEPGLPAILAALDCPGAWACGILTEPMLLGTLTAQVHEEPPLGTELVVLAWETGREGRKRRCGTALLDGERVLAVAGATWLTMG